MPDEPLHIGSRPRRASSDFEAVYRTHRGRCYAVAISIVRDEHLAEDVLQEVFEGLHRHPARFDHERGALSTWLMTLTHHKAVDLVRRRQRRTGLDDGSHAPTQLADLTACPESAVLLDEERSHVRAALDHLKPGERQVIILAYFEGRSQTDIAALTGVPLGTVKSRTSSGLRRMQRHLAAWLARDDRLETWTG